jgi:hypothetical protein
LDPGPPIAIEYVDDALTSPDSADQKFVTVGNHSGAEAITVSGIGGGQRHDFDPGPILVPVDIDKTRGNVVTWFSNENFVATHRDGTTKASLSLGQRHKENDDKQRYDRNGKSLQSAPHCTGKIDPRAYR